MMNHFYLISNLHLLFRFEADGLLKGIKGGGFQIH